MPRSQYVDPAAKRAPGKITFTDIKVNEYQKTVRDELGNYTREEFIGIYHDMLLIREFENMINSIKIEGAYNNVPYSHPGPAHLSMGQEASAVGQAFNLDVDDFIFGSHRSHGEILAKGMSAIRKLDDEKLMAAMSEESGKAALAVVSGRGQSNVKELALDFLLYGAMAEIFARKNGFNMGLGGSMHTFYIPFGIYPNNAIVGGSADIASGAALFKRVNKKGGIVVANIGDGSLGCGPVWEAMNFSAMDQLRQLWDEEHRGGLPILFNVFNNQYAMGGQTQGETMAYDMLARLGAGVTPNQMHAERVDGYNPLAVIDAVRRKKELLLKGEGPVLLDVVTYRYAGHSPSDASSYRTKEDMAAWQEVDPLITYRAQLIEAGVATEAECDALKAGVVDAITRNLKLAIDDAVSPRMDLTADPDMIARMMYTNRHV